MTKLTFLQRRRAQNRAAQRAHRERQKRYVSQLEKRFFALQANYHQLDEKYQEVQKKYASLTRDLQPQPTPLDTPVLETATDPALNFPSTDLHSLTEFSMCEQELDRVLAFRIERRTSPNQQGP